MNTNDKVDTSGIYEGMLEAVEQWNHLLKAVENEQITDDKKRRMVQEYFQLEEGESVIFPGQETNRNTARRRKRGVMDQYGQLPITLAMLNERLLKGETFTISGGEDHFVYALYLDTKGHIVLRQGEPGANVSATGGCCAYTPVLPWRIFK